MDWCRVPVCRQTGAGPDIVFMLHYASSLADVSDLCEWKTKDQGGFYPLLWTFGGVMRGA